MVNDQLIIFKRSSPIGYKVYTKAELQTGDTPYDHLFIDSFKRYNRGVSACYFLNEFGVSVSLHDAFVDDWPRVTTALIAAICWRLGWAVDDVEVRYEDTSGKEEKRETVHVAEQGNVDPDVLIGEIYAATGNAPGTGE